MDNICHTLVGAALGEAGLKHRTRFGNVTLMIASNLPDIDVLVFASGSSPVAFRRGWTHGVIAQLLLPVALTGVMMLVARVKKRQSPAALRNDQIPLRIPWLLALSFVGVYLHVFFDYLNNYGVRLLSPFDWRWFYGDAVFIIDIWLWASLGAGIWLSRRRRSYVPARSALVCAACYVVLMLASARASRDHVIDAWRDARGAEPRALMVGPVPVTPLQRQVIVDAGNRYETGTFSWQSGGVTFSPSTVPKNQDGPEVATARESANVRAFLVWSRFPYWQLQSVPGGTRVTVKDMRFGDRFSAAAIVPRANHPP